MPSFVHIRKWKLEAGDAATPWQMADEDESEATRYLREALKEATAGTTEIAGGLVLSNMMGVKKGGAIVAGINGTDDGHNLPMIWAGALKHGEVLRRGEQGWRRQGRDNAHEERASHHEADERGALAKPRGRS